MEQYFTNLDFPDKGMGPFQKPAFWEPRSCEVAI